MSADSFVTISQCHELADGGEGLQAEKCGPDNLMKRKESGKSAILLDVS